jgi:hypothetical protein
MGLGSGIRKKPNPDPGSATLEKYKEFSYFEVLDVFF